MRSSFRLAACVFFASLVAQGVAIRVVRSDSQCGEILMRTLLWLYNPFVDMVTPSLKSSQAVTAAIVGICVGTLFVSTVVATVVVYVMSLVYRARRGRS